MDAQTWKPEPPQTLEEERPNSNPSQRENGPQKTKITLNELIPGGYVFLDQNGTPYFQETQTGKTTIPLQSREFKRKITSALITKKLDPAPNQSTINDYINAYESCASANPNKNVKLWLRVAQKDKQTILYDTMKDSKIIRITPDKVEVIERSAEDYPIQTFKHYHHMLPAEVNLEHQPEAGTPALDELIDFAANLENNAKKRAEQKILLKAYLVTCLIPEIEHPILIVDGEQGSAKTTFMRVLRELIDPTRLSALETMPTEMRSLILNFDHSYIVYYDNVHTLNQEQNDSFCRASTGAGIRTRALYTDDDEIIRTYYRCIGINGISVVAGRKLDLIDRALTFNLRRIPNNKRKRATQIKQKIGELTPKARAELFHALSKTLAIESTIELTQLPRMADFAHWAEAASQAMNNAPGAFLTAYNKNYLGTVEEAIGDDPVLTALLKIKESSLRVASKAYSLSDLFDALSNTYGDRGPPKDFPKTHSWLGRKLNTLITIAAGHGLNIHKEHTTAGNQWVLSNAGYCEPEADEETASKSVEDEIVNVFAGTTKPIPLKRIQEHFESRGFSKDSWEDYFKKLVEEGVILEPKSGEFLMPPGKLTADQL